ncbi:MAG TPA: FAD-binding domain-containing protein [Candidatus Tumulicola sp.]|jgi:deoxyribodipyrimidine photo-lyase
MADGRSVYRFTHDLRLDDHAGIAAAAADGAIVALLVVDAALEARLRRSPKRAAAYCAATAALDEELRAHGSPLVVRRGPAAAAVIDVARTTGARGAAWSAAYDQNGIEADRRLQSELEEAGLRASVVHDAPAIAPEETAERSTSGDGYRAFGPFLEVWRDVPIASHEHPLLVRFAQDGAQAQGERLPDPAEFGSTESAADAGPAAARKALEAFLRDGATRYAQAANVPSDDRTSRLSAHLSFGTISARSVVAAARKRLEDPLLLSEERFSLRRFLQSLARRDFFLQLSWFHPQTQDEPLQEKMRGFPFARSHRALEAWRAGTTGFPLVDAGIRQLRATGWMHPHARAVAASFLCFDLGVDWRIGRDAWDAHSIEDDPAVATGNWQWIAAVGADMAQYPRIYNPQRQRRRCDPDGSYVRRWVRELERIPVVQWREDRADSPQLTLDLASPSGYPPPVVDHERAAREFLRRYREFAASQGSES